MPASETTKRQRTGVTPNAKAKEGGVGEGGGERGACVVARELRMCDGRRAIGLFRRDRCSIPTRPIQQWPGGTPPRTPPAVVDKRHQIQKNRQGRGVRGAGEGLLALWRVKNCIQITMGKSPKRNTIPKLKVRPDPSGGIPAVGGALPRDTIPKFMMVAGSGSCNAVRTPTAERGVREGSEGGGGGGAGVAGRELLRDGWTGGPVDGWVHTGCDTWCDNAVVRWLTEGATEGSTVRDGWVHTGCDRWVHTGCDRWSGTSATAGGTAGGTVRSTDGSHRGPQRGPQWGPQWGRHN